MHQNKKLPFWGEFSLFCVFTLLFGLLLDSQAVAMESEPVPIPVPAAVGPTGSLPSQTEASDFMARLRRLKYLSDYVARLLIQRDHMKLQSRQLDAQIAATRLQIQQTASSPSDPVLQQLSSVSRENGRLPALHPENQAVARKPQNSRESSLAYYQRLLIRKRELQISLLRQAHQIYHLQQAISQLHSLPYSSRI